MHCIHTTGELHPSAGVAVAHMMTDLVQYVIFIVSTTFPVLYSIQTLLCIALLSQCIPQLNYTTSLIVFQLQSSSTSSYVSLSLDLLMYFHTSMNDACFTASFVVVVPKLWQLYPRKTLRQTVAVCIMLAK